MTGHHEIYFHEDDYCEQQLLPWEVAEYAEIELKKIQDFAREHRAPGGLGWSDVYRREEAPLELRRRAIRKEDFAATVGVVFPEFETVYTGYGSHRERCTRTAAWGTSWQCALFADWDEDQIIQNVWSAFFDKDEASIAAATRVVAAIGARYKLVYVDWAWGYACDASNATDFASKLRCKLEGIAENLDRSKQP